MARGPLRVSELRVRVVSTLCVDQYQPLDSLCDQAPHGLP
jgi:hypothetical protein